ncbi:MerR family transcriptional regulator [Paenibacillus sp. IHB B 3415]|uniref:MerR family transcriptional regulator n=1 Tax=Paenibacillus sp. IHB B 3415 TaxID=867080 RepID=UPI0009FB8D08|nr:MerR family transcriptional regulator [Paenibacillus sp. IHB B 3415]
MKQTAGHTGIPEDTIRYYEKISLLPRVDRQENGHRVYRDKDIETLRLIGFLKKTGMPLERMKPFLKVSADGDSADYPELVDFMRQHREHMVKQIHLLQQAVDFVDLKLEQGTHCQNYPVEEQTDASVQAGMR